jgi:signal transduction histidine kinase
MRGGLGRTLLTAFLILAIGPLSLVGYLAFDRVRNDQQQRALDRVSVIADLTSAQLQDWVAGQTSKLALLSSSIAAEKITARLIPPSPASGRPAAFELAGQLHVTLAQACDLESVWLLEASTSRVWRIIGEGAPCALEPSAPLPEPIYPLQPKIGIGYDGVARFLFAVPVTGANTGGAEFYLLGVTKAPEQFLTTRFFGQAGKGERLFLTNHSAQLFSLEGQPIPAVGAALPASMTGPRGDGLYTNQAGVPVVGARRWLSQADVALIAEQDQSRALTLSDEFAASLIGAILAVALFTAIIASVVTRQMTRPIVRLTEAALLLAEGDLTQRVPTDRRDELGILARVFNQMAADLGELYAGLEKKVAERTSELEEAKAQIQYHAWQLSISAEVGRITTSILDLDTLLDRAAHLIRDAFRLDHAAIYLLDRSGEVAILRKNAGRAVMDYERQIHVSGTHPVSWAIARRVLRLSARPGLFGNLGQGHELALPLALGSKVIGALDLSSYDPLGFTESEQSVLQTLADQLSVAIENARAYGREHEAADEMREVDRLRGKFFAHMSHQLATYLNTIIGFSQLLLKKVEGPLTELQTKDLTMIYQSGQQLSRLLDDIHELANLEVGIIEMNYSLVDLTRLITDLQTTLMSTLNNPQLDLDMQAGPELPLVMADSERLQQVISNLTLTAAEMAPQGVITLRAVQMNGHIQFVISVPALLKDVSQNSNRGISLALSRRLVELHGGRLRVEQLEGLTMFSFTLPVTPEQRKPINTEDTET